MTIIRNSVERALDVPSTDDISLPYVWLKDAQDKDPKLKDLYL